MVHVPHPSDNMCKKTAKPQSILKKIYFSNQIIFVDRVVRVGYPHQNVLNPHFWFSRPDCPDTNGTACHLDLDVIFSLIYMYMT